MFFGFKKQPFIILLVLGSPVRPRPEFVAELAKQAKAVVACDSGAELCQAAGIKIDALIGDNDSIHPEALEYVRQCGAEERLYKIDKDATDMTLALKYIWEKYAPKHSHIDLIVTAATGGRPDHTMATFGSLMDAQALHPRVEEEDFSCHFLAHEWDDHLDFPDKYVDHTISIVALRYPTKVTLKGMRWNLDNQSIRMFSDDAISNIMEEKGASITINQGAALVYIIKEIQHKTRED